jgi:hypothetical protein
MVATNQGGVVVVDGGMVAWLAAAAINVCDILENFSNLFHLFSKLYYISFV